MCGREYDCPPTLDSPRWRSPPPPDLSRVRREWHLRPRRHGPWPSLDDVGDAVVRHVGRWTTRPRSGLLIVVTTTAALAVPTTPLIRGVFWNCRGCLLVAHPVDAVRVDSLEKRVCSGQRGGHECQQMSRPVGLGAAVDRGRGIKTYHTLSPQSVGGRVRLCGVALDPSGFLITRQHDSDRPPRNGIAARGEHLRQRPP